MTHPAPTSRRQPARIAALAFLGVLLAAGSGAALDPGARAPEIGLSPAHGSAIHISELRGKVVIVDFFASWCEPCRQEMPVLERLYQRYRSRGLVIVGVSVDTDAEAMRGFVRRVAISFPVVHDAAHAVANRYRPSPMPSSYFVDRNGIVRHIQRGFRARDAAGIEAKVEELLAAGN